MFGNLKATCHDAKTPQANNPRSKLMLLNCIMLGNFGIHNFDIVVAFIQSKYSARNLCQHMVPLETSYFAPGETKLA